MIIYKYPLDLSAIDPQTCSITLMVPIGARFLAVGWVIGHAGSNYPVVWAEADPDKRHVPRRLHIAYTAVSVPAMEHWGPYIGTVQLPLPNQPVHTEIDLHIYDEAEKADPTAETSRFFRRPGS